jgi:hypothetical protein
MIFSICPWVSLVCPLFSPIFHVVIDFSIVFTGLPCFSSNVPWCSWDFPRFSPMFPWASSISVWEIDEIQGKSMKTWKRGKNHGEIDQNHGKQMKTMKKRWKPSKSISKSMKTVEKETIYTNEKWRTAASRPKIQKHLILVKAIIPHPYLTRMPRFDTKKYSTNACRIALKPLIAYQVEGWFHQGTEQNIWSVFPTKLFLSFSFLSSDFWNVGQLKFVLRNSLCYVRWAENRSKERVGRKSRSRIRCAGMGAGLEA